MYRSILWFGALSIFLFVGAGCVSEPASDPIKIGWLGPLTGDTSSIGNNSLKSAQMAVEEVNAAGGIKGRPVELIAEDAKCNPKDATNAVNKLINIDRVSFINGGLCSSETLAAAQFADQKKVIVLSYCSYAPSITSAGDYTFRTYPSGLFAGQVASSYAYNKLNKKQAAILAALTDSGAGLKKSFSDNFRFLGGQIVFEEDFNQDTRDFKTIITKIKNSGADLLYLPGQTEAIIAFTKQAKELGLEIQLILPDTGDDVKIQETGNAEGVIYTIPSVDISDQAWKEKARSRGIDLSICVPQAYDNIKLLREVIKRVGVNSTAVKNELYKVKGYPGVSGTIQFDQNGDLLDATYAIKQVKNKKGEIIDYSN